MKKVELLAPSGDWDSFLAAVHNGCDAVYLGLGDFNARAKSTYFTMDNIRETVKYAHLFGVRVFVTINTLVRDDEFDAFLKLVQACIDAKVDAYIVQDYGVAYILKKMYPEIELHASTQLGVHNLEGAKIAEKLGFSRIVLSREAKLEDIIEIKQNTNLEVEYFIQGALCVAFSGNCYFSALEHNESGNRGKCLQLCRLPYTAYLDNKVVGDGYLLSARDLCLLPNLGVLINAGVDSFKIEGRLRRAGYVGQTVNSYRKAIDEMNFEMPTETHKLRQVFSRGEFNISAYLDAGVPDKIINKDVQNHAGIYIGEVINVENFKDLYKVAIHSPHPLKSGDGLKFFDKFGKEFASLGVGNVEIKDGNNVIYTKHKLAHGLKVHLTLNKQLEDKVIANKKTLDITIGFLAQPNKPFVVMVEYEYKGIKTEINYTSEYICQEAKTAPTSVQEVTEIFSTLDIEVFNPQIMTCIGNVFIPKSALKEARRTVSSNLKQEIIANYEKTLKNVVKSADPNDFAQNLVDLTCSYDKIYIVNEDTKTQNFEITDSDLVAFSPQKYNIENVKTNIDRLSKLYKNIGFVLPTVANHLDTKILDDIVSTLPQSLPIIINNIYGLKYGNLHKLIAGLDMNVYNRHSIQCLQNLGVNEFVWSKEVAKSVENVYEFTYGHHELMHFCHCPFKTLYQNTCSKCSFSKNLSIVGQNGHKFNITRHNISQCYFTLLQDKLTNKQSKHELKDIRY